MTDQNYSNIPKNWSRTRLANICEIIRGVTYKKTLASESPMEGHLPILRATNIQENHLVLHKDLIFVPQDLVSEKQQLREGDIVVATSSGSIHLVGKTAQVKKSWSGSFGAFCAAIRPSSEIDHHYLGYFFESREYKDFIAKQALGVNINNLRRGDLEEISVPVAPPEQQKRIVAEIEKQFSRLDEAVANLKRVKANLKRYKAAVLKAAVEGKLTEEWRKQHPNVEPASKLLKRILAERRKKWEEAELAKMKSKGKTPKDDKWKKKYKEPAKPDTKGLSELPDGWVWATIEQLTSELMNGYGKRSQAAGKLRIVLRLADITDGEISYEDVRKINCTDNETFKYALKENDILILRVNGSPELVGRFVLVRDHRKEVLFCDHFIRVRCVVTDLAAWLRTYGDSKRFRRFIDLNKVSSAGQNTISQGTLLPFAVPLAPAVEQQYIVDEIQRRFSIVEGIEAEVETNVKRAERLRQSILSKAFSGQLRIDAMAN